MSEEVKYVGFWLRAGAYIVDVILIALITFPILHFVYGESYYEGDQLFEGPIDILVSGVFPAVLVIVFWSIKQATPGKMIVGARIVDSKTGEPASIGQYIGRYLLYFVAFIPFGLGIVWVAFDRQKQGWHDKIAGTVVIRKKKPKAEAISFNSQNSI